MAKFACILALLTANIVVASVIPRQAPGTQFITGPCKVDADCASGCCGFNSGKCAGAIIALTRDGGCGHGEATNSRAAAVLRGNCPGTTLRREIIEEIEARAPLSPDPAGAKNVGNGKGGQFITGQCTSNADCGSGCCATLGNIGICSGPGAADQQGKTGCGFNGGGGGAAPPPPPPPPANNGGAGGSAGSGKPPGTQFITGPCANDGECASGCCGFKSGKCAGAIIAQERDGGCGFGNPTPNDDAARKLRGQAPASPPPPPPAQAPPPPPPVNNGGAAPPAAGGPATAGQTAIGGACGKDSDCTTACCGFTSGKCALAKTAPGSDGGCGKGEAAPNTKAASVIAGNAPIC